MLLHESFKRVICISLPNIGLGEVIRTLDICSTIFITTITGDDGSPSTSTVSTAIERMYSCINNRPTSCFFQVVEACCIVIVKYGVVMQQSGNHLPFYAPMLFEVGSVKYKWGVGTIGTASISQTIYAKGEFQTPMTVPQKSCTEEDHLITFTFLVILGTGRRGTSLKSQKAGHCSSKVRKLVVKFMLPVVRGRPVAS